VLRLDYHLDENTTIRSFARYTRANVSLANFSNFENIAKQSERASAQRIHIL